jgi:micrococcal nuclease
VRIEKDISGADQYGRLLRYVYLPASESAADDVLVNEALIRAGHAQTLAIAPDNRYRDLFATAQEEAKQAQKGIWGQCDLLDPELIRQTDSQPSNPECTIKGNISEKSYGRNYFLPGCPNYNRVKIDITKGEQYFCTETQAKAAGFTRSESCSNTF